MSLYGQQHAITALKRTRTALATAHSQALQQVAVRLDLAMQAFFRRGRAGEAPGYPRFRGAGRDDSFTSPQAPRGGTLTGDRLTLAKIGTVRVVPHRPLAGTPTTGTIRRSSTGKWYVGCSCEVADAPLPPSPAPVGIDVGLSPFAALSTGAMVANPRFFATDERALGRAQRRRSRAPQGSPARRKRRKPVARIHERIAFRRHDFTHQTARRIVNHHGLIAFENLLVARLGHHPTLAKGLHDAAWGGSFRRLSAKAASAGRTFVAVNPAYTSRDCSRCGVRHVMPLAVRVYRCGSCGLVPDRDLHAARNLLAVGLHGLGLGPRSPRL